MKTRSHLFITLILISNLVFAQEKWSLEKCLSHANENNLQILAARLNEQTQEYNYKIAGNQQLPDVNVSLNSGLVFEPQMLSNQADYQYSKIFQNSGSLIVSAPLSNGGMLRLNKEKNLLLFTQNQLITQKTANDIFLQITADYLTLLLNRELLNVNQMAVEISWETVEKNKKLYQAGNIPQSALYEAKANWAAARQNYENVRIEVERARLNLAILLQKDYEDFDIQPIAVPDELNLPLIDVENIVDYAFENQPEIKAAKLGAAAAAKDVKIARAAGFPTVALNYQLGTSYTDILNSSADNKGLSKEWYNNHSQSVTLSVSLPIFNKGINALKISQAKILQEIQDNELKQRKLALEQTIQSACFDVRSSYQSFLAAREAAESAKLSFDFAQKGFDAGKVTVYDLNSARNHYFTAQAQMVQAKYSFLFKLKIMNFYQGLPLSGK